jgi:hypothetical protein
MAAMKVSLGSWIGATTLGWILGVPLVAGLALIGESLGIGGVQVLVGAGMGLGVGLLQGRLVRRLGISWSHWVLACALGLSAPFLVWDVARKLGYDPRFALYLCVIAGGVLVGLWQARLLRARFVNAAAWVPASFIGWTLAAVSAGLSDQLTRTRSVRGIAGALLYLGLVAVGGPLLGWVTGLGLGRLRS